MGNIKDITKTGPQKYRQLQEANNLEEGYLSGVSFKPNLPKWQDFIYEGPERSPIYQASGGTDYLGNSIWDQEGAISEYDWERMQQNPNEIRAENQWVLAKWGAGLGKAVGLAATTFLDGTVGLIYGAADAIGSAVNGEKDPLNKLWENDISKALREFNEAMETALPNYRTQEEIDRPWYQNLGTANFWADSILKNIGFTIGAYYSGGVFTKGLKAVGILKHAFPAQVVGTVASAVNEARIEAGNAEDLLIKNEYGKIDYSVDQHIQEDDAALREKYKPLIEEINNRPDELIRTTTPDGKETFVSKNYMDLQALHAQYQQEKALSEQHWKNQARQLKEQQLDIIRGNAQHVFFMNTALLILTNGWEFGKLYSRSFKASKGLLGRIEQGISEGNIKAVVKDGVLQGWEAIKRSPARKLGKGVSNMIAEGPIEEMGQAWISETAGYWDMYDSPDAYYTALIDPQAQLPTRDFTNAVAKGFSETYGNLERWEEGFAGMIIGGLGTMTTGRVNNSDAYTVLGRGKAIGWSGGILGEFRKASQEDAEAAEAAQRMTAMLKNMNQSMGYFASSKHFTDAMDGYVAQDDKFKYMNASNNSDFGSITSFSRMGRMQDLLDIIGQPYEKYTDEQLEQIAKYTSDVSLDSDGNVIKTNPDGSVKTEGWRAADGSLLTDTAEGREEMRQELIKKRDAMLQSIKLFESSVREVRGIVNNSILSEDQITELAWLNWKGKIFEERYKDVKEKHNPFLQALQRSLREFIATQEEATGVSEDEFNFDKGRHDGESLSEYKERLQKRSKQRNKTLNIETEEGKTTLNNLKTVLSYLEALSKSDSALKFGSLIKANPELLQYMKDSAYGNSILESLSGLDSDTYQQTLQDLTDLGRIADARQEFNERYKDFKDYPANLIKNRKTITERVKSFYEDKVKKKNKQEADAIAQRINFNGNLSEIAEQINNNMADINKAGGLNKWLDKLSEEKRKKVQSALNLNRAKDSFKKTMEENEDLDNDFLKREANGIIDEAAREASNIDELKENAYTILNDDTIDKKVEKSLSAASDLEKQRIIGTLKQAIKETIDQNFDKFKKVIEANEKKEQEEEKIRKQRKKVEEKSKGVSSAPENPDYTEEGTKVSHTSENPDYAEEAGKIDSNAVKDQNNHTNGIIEEGSGEEYNRPQLTELYLHGVDSTSYIDYLEAHKEAIPKLGQGVSQKDFLTYIRETYNYLRANGAFEYIKHHLSVGDRLEFFIDETTDSNGETLSDRAGTTVVVIRAIDKDGHAHIVGTMPTQIDFDSQSKIPDLDEEGNPTGTVHLSKVLSEASPERYKLFSDIIAKYEQDKKAGKNSSSISYFTTTVEQLMGGSLSISTKESTVSDIFTGSSIPILGIMSKESGTIETYVKNFEPEILGEDIIKVPGQVFVLIPTNKGTYIPALCYSVPLREVIERGKDDWYVQQVIKKIQQAPKELSQEGNQFVNELYKWLRLPGMSVMMGHKEEGGKGKWTSDTIPSRATHIVISFDKKESLGGGPAIIEIPLNDDKTVDADVIYNKLKERAALIEDTTTTNVVLSELMNENNRKEYIENITKYLKTNLVVGEGTHTVNDWFTYKNKGNTNRTKTAETRESVKKEADKPQKSGTRLEILGKTYIIYSPDYITDFEGNLIHGKELEDVKTFINATQPIAQTSKQEINQTSKLQSKTTAPEIVQTSEKTETNANPEVQTSDTSAVIDSINALNGTTNTQAQQKEAPRVQKIKKFMEVSDETGEEITSDIVVDRNAEVEYVKKILPQLSAFERITIVDGIIKDVDDKGNPVEAYGRMYNGMMTLINKGPQGVSFHESFHYVTDFLLTDREKSKMFRAARQIYQSEDPMYLEERMAEDFRDYMNGRDLSKGKPSYLKSLFTRLKLLIQKLVGRKTELDLVFYKIYSGRYSDRKERITTEDTTKYMASIVNINGIYTYITDNGVQVPLTIERMQKIANSQVNHPSNLGNIYKLGSVRYQLNNLWGKWTDLWASRGVKITGSYDKNKKSYIVKSVSLIPSVAPKFMRTEIEQEMQDIKANGEFSRENDDIYDNFEEKLLDYRFNKTSFDNLSKEDKQLVLNQGYTKEQWENYSPDQREYILHCKVG